MGGWLEKHASLPGSCRLSGSPAEPFRTECEQLSTVMLATQPAASCTAPCLHKQVAPAPTSSWPDGVVLLGSVLISWEGHSSKEHCREHDREMYLPTVAGHKLQRLDDAWRVLGIEVAVPPALVPLHSSQGRGSARSVALPPGSSR